MKISILWDFDGKYGMSITKASSVFLPPWIIDAYRPSGWYRDFLKVNPNMDIRPLFPVFGFINFVKNEENN